ncbi:MAG: hypothetical protein Ct9H300mP9_0560 [Candidatus Neomarinimicrobiota bacterium]|nr:MAG: hypothetical protein Ct9H300mP9_0560 [Candidatus Neomarinimicrobiota bacterium]
MQNKNYINNEWVDANDGQTFVLKTPILKKPLIRFQTVRKKMLIGLSWLQNHPLGKGWKNIGSLEMRDLLPGEIAVKSRTMIGK